MSKETLGMGVLGCGGFALFAVDKFMQVPGLRVAAVSDIAEQAAAEAARRFGVAGPCTAEELVSSPDVDIVYIATPPFLHHAQAMMALQAGKHVICEKPLAVTDEEAEEMVAAAGERDLLLVANLMQRYSPVFDAVKTLIDSGLLGDVLHGFFENYATDEQLGGNHWFWDREKSGGIFIEHGVHFFDLFAGWLGNGVVEAAQASYRPGTGAGIEDQVQCTVRYGDTVLVNFYHGFTQVQRMDRQEIRLLFERGDISLYEWVPTRVTLHAIADEAGASAIADLFPGARIEVNERYEGEARSCMGRHKPLDIGRKITLYYGHDVDKMARYGELLRAMIQDQSAWIRNRSHKRRITAENGRASVAMAVEAARLAAGGGMK